MPEPTLPRLRTGSASSGAIGLAMTAEDSQIILRNVVKRFDLPGGEITAIDRVSLTVARGEFVCIVGPSGCGKTTLLRILAELETASEGEIVVYYRRTDRPRTAMVFQGESVFPWMTVEENVLFALRSQRLSSATRRDIVGYYLDRVGLTPFANVRPHQLSGGMKQRVSIARAFATDPEILLMDEPFAALDEQNKLLLEEELLRIWEETRKTVLYITHSIEEAVTLGDRVVVMTAHPGRTKIVVPILFERPRSIDELKRQPAFGDYLYRIWSELRGEVVRARASRPPQGGR